MNTKPLAERLMDTVDISAREAKLLTTDKVSWRLVAAGGSPSTREEAPAR